MAKLIDLTGQKIDKLLVLEKAPSRARHVYWRCVCDCGRECEISGESLRKNQPHNCGICELKKTKREIVRQNKKNYLVGQKFGKLTVIKPTNERINNSIVWECVCDCGNKKNVPTHLLKSGHTKSCGCLVRETQGIDITNKRFGKLIALYPIDNKKRSTIIWHCVCDCGNHKIVRASHLTNGSISSCGCLARELLEQRNKSEKQRNVLKKIMIGNKRRAKNEVNIVEYKT